MKGNQPDFGSLFGKNCMLPVADVFDRNNLPVEFEGLRINIYRFSRISDTLEWEIPLHAHKNFEFHYIFAGKGEVKLGMDDITVTAGDFYICAPFIQHSQKADRTEPMQEYCIECEIECMESEQNTDRKLLGQLISLYGKCYNHGNNEKILMVFRELENLYVTKESFASRIFTKSMMLSVILYMLTTIGKECGDVNRKGVVFLNSQRAVSIRNYLESNLMKNITIRDCANVFYLSERHIDRIMKEEYNETFYQYLQRLRTEVAVRLLASTNTGVDEIAEKSGFGSYRNMIRSFKRLQMKNPSEIRRDALREKQKGESVK